MACSHVEGDGAMVHHETEQSHIKLRIREKWMRLGIACVAHQIQTSRFSSIGRLARGLKKRGKHEKHRRAGREG